LENATDVLPRLAQSCSEFKDFGETRCRHFRPTRVYELSQHIDVKLCCQRPARFRCTEMYQPTMHELQTKAQHLGDELQTGEYL
jgi:hypothetical protein